MADTIEIDELTKTLHDFAYHSSYENVEKIQNGIDKITQEVSKEVKELSPVYEGKSKKLKKGAYKKGWVTSFLKRDGTYRKVIHNKNYRLVHLLENGHDLLDSNGKKYGEVPAHKHIETAYQHAEEKVDALLRGI
ncbi:MAG: hypothetical protein NC177_14380 [Ruminococcus flavefaciens]|nr:hypothetical protein [Ruminococcus flavefaciens]